jgi:hypothetical protein
MRNLLAGAGGLFVLLIAVGVGLGIWTIRSADHGPKSARAYVDEAVPAITAHWDSNELTTRAAPALLRVTDAGKLKVLFVWLSTLGPLQAYQGASLQGTAVQTSPAGTITTTRYLASAHYEHGDARIDVLLIRDGALWQILGFHVNSAALAPQGATERL